MEFKHLKISECPVCGCTTVIKESRNTFHDKVMVHCNGEQWESRTFLCGMEAKWIPNFSCTEFEECGQDPKVKKREKKRKKLIEEIKTIVESSNADENFKQNVLIYLPKP